MLARRASAPKKYPTVSAHYSHLLHAKRRQDVSSDPGPLGISKVGDGHCDGCGRTKDCLYGSWHGYLSDITGSLFNEFNGGVEKGEK